MSSHVSYNPESHRSFELRWSPIRRHAFKDVYFLLDLSCTATLAKFKPLPSLGNMQLMSASTCAQGPKLHNVVIFCVSDSQR